MNSDCNEPLNLGSEEMITINELVGIVAGISGKDIYINNVPGPLGVNARVSDNTLIREKLNWAPAERLREGLEVLYAWVQQQVQSE